MKLVLIRDGDCLRPEHPFQMFCVPNKIEVEVSDDVLIPIDIGAYWFNPQAAVELQRFIDSTDDDGNPKLPMSEIPEHVVAKSPDKSPVPERVEFWSDGFDTEIAARMMTAKEHLEKDADSK